jgi:hypothetical protein
MKIPTLRVGRDAGVASTEKGRRDAGVAGT